MQRNWTENELLIAMNLYCRLPFGQCNSSKLDRKVWAEFQNNWSVMAGKCEAAFEALMGDAIPEKSDPDIEFPNSPSEVKQTVKIRRIQSFFRNVVLADYENCCALTGINVPQLLVASHIIPWSENENRRADPTNGICLKALYDKEFDRHLIAFDEDLRLVVSDLIPLLWKHIKMHSYLSHLTKDSPKSAKMKISTP